jgi:hypothetical protein
MKCNKDRDNLHCALSAEVAVKKCVPETVTADSPELGATLGLIALGNGVG